VQKSMNVETMPRPAERASALQRTHSVDNLSRQAWRWLQRLRDVMPSESGEFACCFERVDGASPEAWIAVGRLAEITCDVRDGTVVGQLTAGSRLLSKQLLSIEDSELPYVKVFSALASLLRTERALL